MGMARIIGHWGRSVCNEFLGRGDCIPKRWGHGRAWREREWICSSLIKWCMKWAGRCVQIRMSSSELGSRVWVMYRVMEKIKAFSSHMTINQPPPFRGRPQTSCFCITGGASRASTQPTGFQLFCMSVCYLFTPQPFVPVRSTPKQCKSWHSIITKHCMKGHLLCLHFTVVNLYHGLLHLFTEVF